MVFEAKMRPLMEHVGKNGCITNKGIMSILETVAAYQSEEAGYGITDIDKNGVSWVQLDWKIKVIKRPKFPELLTVKTWGRDSTKIATYRDYELYNENNELCVIATTKWILVDINTKKIVRITEDIMKNYKLSDKRVFDEIELDKLTIPESEIIKTITFKPKQNNIDVNGHVHNLDYIDMAYEALPEEILDNTEFNNIRITYKKEIKLQDEVTCNYTLDNNTHVVVMENSKDKTLNCIVKLELT